MNGKAGILSAIGVGAATAGLIAGCGSSKGTAGTAQIGGSAITQAANVSGAADGQKVQLALTEQLPSVGTLTGSGTGSFNRSPVSGQIALHIALPQAAAQSVGSALDLHEIIRDDTLYMSYGGAFGSKLKRSLGGKSWLSIDFTKLGSKTKLPGLSGLLGGSATASPSDQFKTLTEAATNGLAKVGSATIDGVSTTEYSETLDLTKAAATYPAAKRAAIEKVLAASAKSLASTNIPVKVWIDADHMIRREMLTETVLLQGVKAPITVTQTILAYGAQPVPAAPPASQTKDLTSQVSQGISSGG